MNFILDVIIIVICICIIFKYTRRGFIKSVMNFGSNIAGILVGYAFTPVIAPIISKKYLLPGISSGIKETLKSLMENANGKFDIEKAFTDLPPELHEIISRYGANIDELKKVFGNINDGAAESVEALGEMIATPVSNTISTVMVFIGLFIITIILLGIVTFVLDLIFKMPILETANSSLGFLFGVLCAIITAWIISLAAGYLVTALSSVYPQIFDKNLVKNSLIVDFFTQYNPIQIVEDMLSGK